MRDYIWTYNDDMYSNISFDPQAKIHVLATTHDSSASYAPELASPKYPASAYTPEKLKAMKGMDSDLPAIWTVNYDEGRVFTFTIGHDEISLGSPAIDAFLLRGTEWAATGDVTIPLPPDAKAFPLQ